METKVEAAAAVKVLRKRAHGLSGDPGVRFTVPSHYGDAFIEGRCWWPTFEEAVEAARSKIERFEYDGGKTVKYSRAFVAMRASYVNVPKPAVSVGSDEELMRWEVTPTAVVIGYLTDEQRTELAKMDAPAADDKAAWA